MKVKTHNYYSDFGVRQICHALKSKNQFIKTIAIIHVSNYFLKQKCINNNSVLIPAPQHQGNAEYTLRITRRIARKTGAKVLDILKCKPHESLYKWKKSEEYTGLPSLDIGLYLSKKISDEDKIKNVFFVDNVISTGKTYNEANKLLNGILEPMVYAIDFDKIKLNGGLKYDF